MILTREYLRDWLDQEDFYYLFTQYKIDVNDIEDDEELRALVTEVYQKVAVLAEVEDRLDALIGE